MLQFYVACHQKTAILHQSNTHGISTFILKKKNRESAENQVFVCFFSGRLKV
jgi:hypothetical protein